MTAVDLVALLPFLVLGAAAVLVMLLAAFGRSHELIAAVTAAALVLAFAALWAVPAAAVRQVTALLVVDDYALFYIGLVAAAGFAVALLGYGYLRRQGEPRAAFYLLLLLAILGAAVLVASSHLASLFLGLEILSVSLYGLIAYTRGRDVSVEAGLKYLILAAASAAFLLFGIALVYAQEGTMELERLASLAGGGRAPSGLLLAGLALIVVGVGFKLAVVPFHMWTPDVYQGAPAPVTAFVATVSKGAMFALILRYFARLDLLAFSSLFVLFAAIAIASMLVGNLLALLQANVKRILAYSSISHLGYLLVAFLAGGTLALTAATYYLVAYFVTSLGAFGVVTVLSGAERDADSLEDYRGLFWRQRWLAVVLTAMLLSLAGMPFTAGFVGKFYVAAAGVSAGQWLLVIVLVVASAIGLFYYLRVAAAMYQRQPAGAAARDLASAPSALGVALLTVLMALLVVLGVYPTPLIQLIQATVGRLA